MPKFKNFSIFLSFLLICSFIGSFCLSCKKEEIANIKIVPALSDAKLDVKTHSAYGKKLELFRPNNSKIYIFSCAVSGDSKIKQDQIDIEEFHFDNAKSSYVYTLDGFLGKTFYNLSSEKLLLFIDNLLFIVEKGVDKIYLNRINLLNKEKKTIYARNITPKQREEFFQPFGSAFNCPPDFIYERVKPDLKDRDKLMVYYIPQDKLFYKELPELVGITTFETKNYLYYYTPKDKKYEIHIFKKPDFAVYKVLDIDEKMSPTGADYENDFLIFCDNSYSRIQLFDLKELKIVNEIESNILKEFLNPEKKSLRWSFSKKGFIDLFFGLPYINNQSNFQIVELKYDIRKDKFNINNISLDFSKAGEFGDYRLTRIPGKLEFALLLKSKGKNDLYLCLLNISSRKAQIYLLNRKLGENFSISYFDSLNGYLYWIERLSNFPVQENNSKYETDILTYLKVPDF
jgi:hypothetical protein